MKNPTPVIFAFAAIVLVLALIAVILDNVSTAQTTGSAAQNATNDSIEFVTGFTSLIPVFGVLLGAFFLVFMVVWLFKKKSY